MLINTVVLLLRELLPLIVLLSLLLALFPLQANRLLGWSLTLALPLLVVQSSLYQWLSTTLDGQAIELWYSCCYLLCAFGLFLSLRANKSVLLVALVLAVLALTLVNGGNLLLYLLLYPRQSEESQSLWLGVALGSGISISIGVLLYHLARELRQVWSGLTLCLIALSCARQTMSALALWQQLDWLDGTPLWNSQHLLAENTELGFFLQALLGYEASPSAWQFAAYTLVIAICWLFSKKGRRYG